MCSRRHNVRVASVFLSLLWLGSFSLLYPVNDVLSVHHGGTMLFVTPVVTPSPSPRQSDCRRTCCGRVHRPPPPNLISAADRRQLRPWRPPSREVGAAAAAAAPAAAAAAATTTDASPSCATLRGGEGGQCLRGGTGGGGCVRRLQGAAAATTAAAAAAGTWGARLPPPPLPWNGATSWKSSLCVVDRRQPRDGEGQGRGGSRPLRRHARRSRSWRRRVARGSARDRRREMARATAGPAAASGVVAAGAPVVATAVLALLPATRGNAVRRRRDG